MKGGLSGSLPLIMMGVFLSTLDSGMINVALPTLMRSLHIDFATAGSVVILYLLTITASLVFWGRLADRLGRSFLYVTGIAFFCCGSLGSYLSVTFSFLLVGRFVQALGAAMMMSSGPAIIRDVSVVDNLGRNLGLVGIATASGLMAGPFVAGLLIRQFSWKAIFCVEAIVAMICLVAAILVFRPRVKPIRRLAEWPPFDWLGMMLWSCIVVYGVVLLHRIELLLNFRGVIACTLFLLLVVIFLRLQKKTKNPIVPIHVVIRPYYLIGVITAAVSFGILFAVLVLTPFYLEYVLALPVDKVGSVMMAVPATVLFFSPLSGWLYDRIGARILTTFGLVVSTGALATMLWVDKDTALAMIIVRLVVIGGGQAIFLSPNSASVLARVESSYIALTSGILATARNLGMVTGATVAAAGFSLWFSNFSGGGKLSLFSGEMTGAFLQAFHATIGCAAILGAVGCVLSAFRKV